MARKNKNRRRKSPAIALGTRVLEAPSSAPEPVDTNTPLDTNTSPFDTNTQLLLQIQSQLESLCEGVISALPPTVDSTDARTVEADAADVKTAEIDMLRERIAQLDSERNELEQQNGDLAAQLAAASARQTVASDDAIDETLSWEDRKKLIMRQMEEEDFDAEAFVLSWVDDGPEKMVLSESPAEYVLRLNEELARRDREISDLRHLLDQQSATQESGVSIGAAGIAQMIESDELIVEERDRLQGLQSEWEAKFRQAEIEASLERAKLSRERRELATKQAELERELEGVRLRAIRAREKDAPRKWLSQLGLATS